MFSLARSQLAAEGPREATDALGHLTSALCVGSGEVYWSPVGKRRLSVFLDRIGETRPNFSEAKLTS